MRGGSSTTASGWRSWAEVDLGLGPYPLGRRSNFPIHEALAILTAVAARTSKIKVGTGILVMPMRNPVLLAKELATIDHISEGRLIVGAAVGWYKREFDSLGADFHQRGKVMEQCLEVINACGRRRRSTATIPLQAARRRALPQAGAEGARRS